MNSLPSIQAGTRAVALAAVLLAGCSALEELNFGATGAAADSVRRSEIIEPAGVDGVIIRMAESGDKTPRQLQEEKARVERKFRTWGDVESRIELAWLLSRPRTGFRNTWESIELLDEYLQTDGQDESYRALASVLRQLLWEVVRQRSATIKYRDALDDASIQGAIQDEQIQALRSLLDKLQQQFEALKDIERNMSQRSEPEPEL